MFLIYKQIHQLLTFFFKQRQNEIAHLIRLQHPNILRYFGNDDKTTCVLIEYLPHGSLFKVLKQGKLELPIAKALFIQILNAVEYIHQQGIYHGDIKADNLLISDQYQVKICDFGFARTYKQGQPSLPVGGSRGYCAPEIFWNKELQEITKCDVFSLGVLFFISVTGYPPFVSNNPNDHDPWWELIQEQQFSIFWTQLESNLGPLPNEFKVIIEAVLQPDPTKRIKLSQIKEFPWLIEQIATPEQLQYSLKQLVQKSTTNKKSQRQPQ